METISKAVAETHNVSVNETIANKPCTNMPWDLTYDFLRSMRHQWRSCDSRVICE